MFYKQHFVRAFVKLTTTARCHTTQQVPLIYLASAILASTATADTILFESGTLGSTGVTWQQAIDGDVPGENILPTAFCGVRFELEKPVVVSQIGGHFVEPPDSDAKFFAAIVALDDANDFPDSDDLSTSDVLGATLLEFPKPSEEVFGDLDLALNTGWYALVFGSGLFGASGSGGVLSNSTDIGNPDYIGFLRGFGWGHRLPSKRFVVKGSVIPEPSAFFLASIASVFFMLQRRSSPTYLSYHFIEGRRGGTASRPILGATAGLSRSAIAAGSAAEVRWAINRRFGLSPAVCVTFGSMIGAT